MQPSMSRQGKPDSQLLNPKIPELKEKALMDQETVEDAPGSGFGQMLIFEVLHVLVQRLPSQF